MSVDAPSVAVILLNWNNTDDTLACLESLRKGSAKNFHVFLVDNGSRLEERQKLVRAIQKQKDVTPIFLAENSGFAAGNNTALKLAILEPFDYFLLLNNDTIVADNFLEALLGCARAHPEAGGFGAKIYYFGDPCRLWYAGGRIDWARGRVVQFGFRQVDRGQFDEARSVSFVTGCALLLPRRTLERVGYLDERFFSYFEDVDFSIRIEREVGKLWYCPAAKLWHKVGAGANTRAYTPYYLYYQTRNRLWVFGRGRNFFLKARFFLLNFVLYFLGRLGYILVSKSENKGLQVQAVVLGFFHSLVGKRGRNIRWEV